VLYPTSSDFCADEMTCLDITMEEKWTYSWGLGSEGAKIPPKNRVRAFLWSRVHIKADDGA